MFLQIPHFVIRIYCTILCFNNGKRRSRGPVGSGLGSCSNLGCKGPLQTHWCAGGDNLKTLPGTEEAGNMFTFLAVGLQQ